MSATAQSIRDFVLALGNWRSTIALLTLHEITWRFRGSRAGALISFAEPFLLVTLIISIRAVFMERTPAYGHSAAVFYSSGVFPFYLFVRLSARGRATRYDAAQRLPRVSSTDLIVASMLGEAVLFLGAMVIWFFGLWLLGLHEAVPRAPLDCLYALALMAALGVGVGLLNSAVARRFPLWSYVYGTLSRVLLFASGVLYIVDFLPLFVRQYVVWNPLAHGVEWFRLGLYGRYPDYTLDRQYLIMSAAVALFAGIVAHRATVRVAR